jgi:N-acetylmuramic acid 6-phosphate etherase
MENSTTEARNEATMHLDEMTVEEALITMNKDRTIFHHFLHSLVF